MVVFARNERHNHAAFWGLRKGQMKQCEPRRSGAVTPKVSVLGAALGAKCVAFCVGLGRASAGLLLRSTAWLGRSLLWRAFAAEKLLEHGNIDVALRWFLAVRSW